MQIHIDERKWPDEPHWQIYGERIGEDEHGVWLWIPQGSAVRKGFEEPIALTHGFVMLVPRDEWWLVEFYTDHPWHLVYVNIGTPPEWDGARFTQIDLDLDVARKIDESVVVLDEDEFLDHQSRYGYPEDLIDSAKLRQSGAVSLLRAGTEPFGGAARRWLDFVGIGDV